MIPTKPIKISRNTGRILLKSDSCTGLGEEKKKAKYKKMMLKVIEAWG